MKDLLVYTADADASAFIGAVLGRPLALGMREITFDIKRHPQKDSGIVRTGAELARMEKREYHKALLIWDFHGSGREQQGAPEESEAAVQEMLNNCTWSGSSAAIAMVPELEEWLWHNPASLERYCEITQQQLQAWMLEFCAHKGCTIDRAQSDLPKEMFEYIRKYKCGKTISPKDFDYIGRICSLQRLRGSASFLRMAEVLQGWFPCNADLTPEAV
jgi:hypothetical protein